MVKKEQTDPEGGYIPEGDSTNENGPPVIEPARDDTGLPDGMVKILNRLDDLEVRTKRADEMIRQVGKSAQYGLDRLERVIINFAKKLRKGRKIFLACQKADEDMLAKSEEEQISA